jgi:hypothetical protein
MVGKIADAIIEGKTESESAYDHVEYEASPEAFEDEAPVTMAEAGL